MFGFGIGKLLVLAAIIAAVWYGFKMVGRLDAARRDRPGGNDRVRRRGGGPGDAPPKVEETVQCPVCDAYVVASSTSPCDRPDCPY